MTDFHPEGVRPLTPKQKATLETLSSWSKDGVFLSWKQPQMLALQKRGFVHAVELKNNVLSARWTITDDGCAYLKELRNGR